MSYRRIKMPYFECTCERCSHVWQARVLPKHCAGCHTRSWDVVPGSVKLGPPFRGKTPRKKKGGKVGRPKKPVPPPAPEPAAVPKPSLRDFLATLEKDK